jgi:hypothetical protein
MRNAGIPQSSAKTLTRYTVSDVGGNLRRRGPVIHRSALALGTGVRIDGKVVLDNVADCLGVGGGATSAAPDLVVDLCQLVADPVCDGRACVNLRTSENGPEVVRLSAPIITASLILIAMLPLAREKQERH